MRPCAARDYAATPGWAWDLVGLAERDGPTRRVTAAEARRADFTGRTKWLDGWLCVVFRDGGRWFAQLAPDDEQPGAAP